VKKEPEGERDFLAFTVKDRVFRAIMKPDRQESVSNPCDDVTMDQVVTYFNMDMVGLGDAIDAPGALNFPTIWNVIKKDQDKEIIQGHQ